MGAVDFVKWFLLAVAFALELAALAALGYWGFKTGGSTATKLALGLGAPILAAVIWGLFVAPKATVDNEALRIIFEIVVFGAAALALVAVGRTSLAIAFAAVALVDDVLVRLLDA